MKYLKQAIHILIIILIQTILCPYIKIGGVMPDLLFIYVLYQSSKGKSMTWIMCTAAICGALADCLTGRIFGIYVSVYLIAAVCVFVVKEAIFKNGLILSILTVFLICIAGKSLFYTMNISVLKDTGYLYSLIKIILPEAIYNTVIFLAVKLLGRRTNKRKAGDY